MNQPTHQKPIRAGLFGTVEHAEKAVTQLLDAGFDKSQISVICSDETKESHFEKFRPDHEVSKSGQPVIAETTFAGGALGAMVSLAGVVTTGGISVVAIGPVVVGALAGTLLGALVGRGIEDELARFYDQAVEKGEILVAVDIHEEDERQADRLATASRILESQGTKPLPLEEE